MGSFTRLRKCWVTQCGSLCDEVGGGGGLKVFFRISSEVGAEPKESDGRHGELC